ncbi:MAG: hypothetical protein V2I33_16785 [Kangiellaceae bacterium]|jgi:hypothetical protein|nr:hypothetical protein [Kangiellaceae bacterium]
MYKEDNLKIIKEQEKIEDTKLHIKYDSTIGGMGSIDPRLSWPETEIESALKRT